MALPFTTDDMETDDATSSISLLELSQTLEGRWVGNPPATVDSVVIDSRNCGENSLFVALPGTNTHGHEFIEQARENGAVAVFVEEKQSTEIPQFVVEESETALQNLAVNHRRSRQQLFVIGVTGSCGKTTVKEMIAHLLSPKYEVGKTPGNYNNQLGVPLTLLNESGGDVLVAELGMNLPGEIRTLTDWSRPSLGVITHIGPAHLEGLGDVKTVAEEKGDLIGGLPEDGIAVLPGWVREFERLREKSAVKPRVLDRNVEADYPIDWEETPSGVDLRVGMNEYELSFGGDHLLRDAAIAVVVALEMGVPEAMIARQLTSFEPLEGRGRIIDLDGTKVIDDGYNANPDSFEAALKRLGELPAPRLALVGDMKEMGDKAEHYHRQLGQQLAGIDDLTVYFVGEHGNAVLEGAGEQSMTAVDQVDDLPEINPRNYQSILVKASHAVGLNDVLDRWLDQP